MTIEDLANKEKSKEETSHQPDLTQDFNLSPKHAEVFCIE